MHVLKAVLAILSVLWLILAGVFFVSQVESGTKIKDAILPALTWPIWFCMALAGKLVVV